MRIFNYVFILSLFFVLGCKQNERLVDYVNPFIGTGGKGHTYPGATAPFGMVQLSPDNGIGGWDEISGYFYDHNTIAGFSHTHLTGTGVGDMYDISFMPVVLPYKQGTLIKGKPDKGIYSTFSHDKETAKPGYYSVSLLDYNIDVELTATERCGFHRYKFPQTNRAQVILNLGYCKNWDFTTATSLEVTPEGVIKGSRFSEGWAKGQKIFFAAEFDKKWTSKEIIVDTVKTKTENILIYKAKFNFITDGKTPVQLRVGISYADENGAEKNLRKEIPHWNFDQIRNETEAKWEKELSKIKIRTTNSVEREKFYTFLYQSMLAPTLYSDIDGRYHGPNKKINKVSGFENYCTFSLWDTYRAAHPLYTIMHTDRVNDMIKSLVQFYDEYGLLPVWPLAGSETDMMIGYHSVPVIADAIVKGIGDFDKKHALEACIASANSDVEGIPLYKKFKYIPFEKEVESVSKTMEYSYDDWCIAEIAKVLHKEDVYKEYKMRSEYLFNLYDASTGFFRPKNEKGEWFKEFNPRDYNEHYCESNAWQYLWSFPHDVYKTIDLMGGNKKFVAKLDECFNATVKTDEDLPIFSTGMIGQYVHGNEPSHHAAYLYNYAGEPWKTQEWVRKILTELYTDKPDGICGNEDCGQMASWYVFSSLGFYPVNPANSIYVFGAPLFDEATINLENGAKFTVLAKNQSLSNKYVQSVKLNGKPYKNSFIRHSEIIKGGTLEFVMGDKPNTAYGVEKTTFPPSK